MCWKGKQISLTLNLEVREDVEPPDFSAVRETVAPPWLRTSAESTLLAEGLNLVGAVHTTAVSDCGLKPNALRHLRKTSHVLNQCKFSCPVAAEFCLVIAGMWGLVVFTVYWAVGKFQRNKPQLIQSWNMHYRSKRFEYKGSIMTHLEKCIQLQPAVLFILKDEAALRQNFHPWIHLYL